MAQQYLLPCECGKANTVTVAQAGRRLTCDCGRDYTVPTLAALRQLEPASAPVGKSGPAGEWSSTRGGLFVLGVIVALAGLAIGGYGAYLIRNVDLEKIEQHFSHIETDDLEHIEHMTPVETYEVWQKILEMGPGAADSAFTVQARNFRDFWLRVAIIGFSAAAVGILMAAGSLVGARR